MSEQLIISSVGAAVGGLIGGPTGAQIGWGISAVLGNATFSKNTLPEGSSQDVDPQRPDHA